MWNPPALQLKWGAYFRDDVAEQASVVTMTVAAKTAGIITEHQAVEKLAPIYGTDDVDDVLKQLKTESAERQKQAIETAQATKPQGNVPPKQDDKPE